MLTKLSRTKSQYDLFSSALEQAQATGYGIVLPTRTDMELSIPELIKKNGVSGIRLRASAPSVHIIRVDLDAEVCPMVGSEQQAKDLADTLIQAYENDHEKLWDSNFLGCSVYEMINNSIGSKLHRLPQKIQERFRSALTKTVNEGTNGMICILF